MKTIRNLICFCLLVAATTCVAQQMENRPLMTVNVPFEFTVGERALPAGAYQIESLVQMKNIRLSSAEGNLSAIVLVSPLYAARPSEKTCLVFNRYGNAYFLKEIWVAGNDVARSLAEGKWEQELASNHQKPQSSTVLAELKRR
jgi:hypothetical protein